LARAEALGADVTQEAPVTRVWNDAAGGGNFNLAHRGENGNAATTRARFLVAADGRNSAVARWAGMLAKNGTNAPNRVGLQTHAPHECCPPEFLAAGLVQMRWFPGGGSAYGGLAPVGNGELNLSLVGAPARLEELKRWAQAEFGLPTDWAAWRTIAPLDRAPARPPARADGVFLVGDAARVVEPFTGEGIYYALISGELAAAAIVRAARGECATAQAAHDYARAHRRLYQARGRLWVNRLARAAVLHPRLAEWALALAQHRPGILRMLTAKVVR
ncbi:MAG: FAD-dependent monooxygenase, partial [Verrucomicrobia bacterium]|nr:FAD-dependent monooxygenase [Verrucomicrobiota bacterium]